MTTTQDLLGVIADLRQRLERAQGSAGGIGPVAAPACQHTEAEGLDRLRKKIAAANRDQHLLQSALRQAGSFADAGALPPHLTSRAARLVRQTRELLHQLKNFTGEPLLQQEAHAAALHYQDTVLLADLVLRTIQTLPEKTTLQLRHCSGIDVLLGLIRQRLGTLEVIVQRHQKEQRHLVDLADLLHRLHQGTLADVNPLFILAEELVADASEAQALTFVTTPGLDALQCLAAHCLTTARVIARVAREDAHWRSTLLQPVVAALVHDVGMLTVPADLLAQPGPLDSLQRGAIERHCRAGAQLLAEVGKSHPWLADAARNHHERLDGTGYPAGLNDVQIDPLARLLAVCDVYSALCAPRPHRAAFDTRAALLETHLLAEKGLLDRHYARLLLVLNSYPVGSAVELNDGSCGVVVAVEQAGAEVGRLARPVVAVLTDVSGVPLPHPRLLDLASCDDRHVQRSLTAEERAKLFGTSYPQYVSTS
jgi:hypothetical protein